VRDNPIISDGKEPGCAEFVGLIQLRCSAASA